LIKASAGGGKGMRVVENEEEFESQMKRAISEAINALVMVLFFIEKYVGHHAISKFKLWLTVMGISCIYSKENAAYNVAIKSHRRSSFLCFNTRITKKNG
jgi:biotin carboxylase